MPFSELKVARTIKLLIGQRSKCNVNFFYGLKEFLLRKSPVFNVPISIFSLTGTDSHGNISPLYHKRIILGGPELNAVLEKR